MASDDAQSITAVDDSDQDDDEDTGLVQDERSDAISVIVPS
jgi:hypothetical protein